MNILNIFKIALPGFSVKNSKPDQEAINSNYPSPKVDTLASPPHAGLIRLNWSSTGLVFAENTSRILYSFPHHYSHIPSVFGSYHFDNGSRRVNGIMPIFIGALGVVVLDSDSTNVNLKYFSFDKSGVTPVPPFLLNVRFYVFAERGHS